MSWIALSLVAPLFWTWNAIMDQVVVRGFFKDKSEAALFIGSLGSPFLMVGFAALYPSVFNVTTTIALSYIALGAYLTLCFYPYFKAVEKTEASILVAMFQLTPVLVFFLGWLFLGETVSLESLIGSLLVVLGSVFITFDFKTNRLDRRALWFMSLSVIMLSLYYVLTRAATIEHDWKAIAFWMAVGSFLLGLGVIGSVKTYRDIFLSTLQKGNRSYLVICLSQEVVYYTGIIISVAAISKTTSVGLAKSVMSIEPVYAFIAASICGLFFPQIFERLEKKRFFAWKMGCIAFSIFGIYLIYAN
ncbi:MAG: EamA family transporter [Pseudomonadota bacterium]